VSVSASIGLARVDPFDPTLTVDELLVRADLAMYVVKRRGGAGVLLHTVGLQLEEVDDVAMGRALAHAAGAQSSHSGLPADHRPVDWAAGGVGGAGAMGARGHPASPEVFVRVAESVQSASSLTRCSGSCLQESALELAAMDGATGSFPPSGSR